MDGSNVPRLSDEAGTSIRCGLGESRGWFGDVKRFESKCKWRREAQGWW